MHVSYFDISNDGILDSCDFQILRETAALTLTHWAIELVILWLFVNISTGRGKYIIHVVSSSCSLCAIYTCIIIKSCKYLLSFHLNLNTVTVYINCYRMYYKLWYIVIDKIVNKLPTVLSLVGVTCPTPAIFPKVNKREFIDISVAPFDCQTHVLVRINILRSFVHSRQRCTAAGVAMWRNVESEFYESCVILRTAWSRDDSLATDVFLALGHRFCMHEKQH